VEGRISVLQGVEILHWVQDDRKTGFAMDSMMFTGTFPLIHYSIFKF
jgi:hypothetical protein